MIDLQTKPALNTLFRLQFEQAQNCFVLLYPEGIVKLNDSASTILKYCDGKNTIKYIISDIKKHFADANKEDIITFIQQAYQKQWLL